MSLDKAVEFRGCDNLVIAEVTTDTAAAFETGSVTLLAPVAEVAKTVQTNSETHYYDNVGMITIRAEGTDEVTVTVPVLPLSILAKITGKTIDVNTGAFLDGDPVEKYYAIGYRLKLTDSTFRYVWRMKGTFSFPDETSSTENDGVDTNNQEIVYTGVQTIHEFTNGGRCRAVVIDERDGKCDLSTFFDTVQTPDTIAALANTAVTALSVSPTTATVAVGATTTITPTITPSTAGIAWASSNTRVATVSGGVVTGVQAGTAVVTATSGAMSASCTVTVTSE